MYAEYGSLHVCVYVYVFLVHMKDTTLFSTARTPPLPLLSENPCHAGCLMCVVYSKCEYVTRGRLNYVRVKCVAAALTSVKTKAWRDSQAGDDELLAHVPSLAPNEAQP
jgi:hypothetical protein